MDLSVMVYRRNGHRIREQGMQQRQSFGQRRKLRAALMAEQGRSGSASFESRVTKELEGSADAGPMIRRRGMPVSWGGGMSAAAGVVDTQDR